MMSEVTKASLKKALKPFDIVETKAGSIGFIKEVGVNHSQDSFAHQISYSVVWIVVSVLEDGEPHNAWWSHSELKFHCNIMIKIAEEMCHNFGDNSEHVQKLFNSMSR